MRAGVNEFVTAPGDGAGASGGDQAADGHLRHDDAWRDLRVHRRQGWRRRDDGGGEHRVITRQAESESTLMIDLNAACGDAAVFLGAEPRFSVMDALENVRRLDAAFFSGLVVRTKGGLDLLGAAARPVSRTSSRAGSVRCSISPVRPINTRCSTCRVPTRRRSTRSNWRPNRAGREPGAGDGPQREPDGGDAEAALRRRVE